MSSFQVSDPHRIKFTNALVSDVAAVCGTKQPVSTLFSEDAESAYLGLYQTQENIKILKSTATYRTGPTRLVCVGTDSVTTLPGETNGMA